MIGVRSIAMRRVRLGCAALIAATGALLPRAAHAQLSVSVDKIVLLSDGAALRIGVRIADSPGDLQSLTFIVHGPASAHLVAVKRVSGGAAATAGPVHLTYSADQPAGSYAEDVSVTAGAPGIDVSAYLTVTAGGSTVVGTITARGRAGQPLHLAPVAPPA